MTEQQTTSIQEIRHKANELRTLIEKFMSDNKVESDYVDRSYKELNRAINFLEQWKD